MLYGSDQCKAHRGRSIKSKIIGTLEKLGGGAGWMKWDLIIRAGANVDRTVGSPVSNINPTDVTLINTPISCKRVTVGSKQLRSKL